MTPKRASLQSVDRCCAHHERQAVEMILGSDASFEVPTRETTDTKFGWEKTLAVFEIIRSQPDISARELRIRAESKGLELSKSTAHRMLSRYKDGEGDALKVNQGHTKSVAEVLQQSPEGEHLTAADIVAETAKSGTKLHISTVYRVLERLLKVGLIVQLEKERKSFYEWKREGPQHSHLTCIGCGKTIEFHQEYLEAFSKRVCLRHEFDYIRYEFNLLAHCSTCR